MKIKLVSCAILLFFLCDVSQSQVLTTFSGQFKISYINAIDAVQYELKGTFTDNSMNFTADNVNVGDRIVDGNGYMFEILTIQGINGSEISTISKALNNEPPTMGFGVIYHPSTSGYPMTAAGTSDVVMSSIINTSTLSIDGNTTKYLSGLMLPTSSNNAGDIVQYAGDSKLYKLTSSGWTQLIEGDIPTSYSNPVTNTPAGNKGDAVLSYWDGLYYVYNGTAWISPSVKSVLEAAFKYGDVFYHTTEKKLYMMGGEGEWACISSSTMAGGPTSDRPITTTHGDFYFSTDENTLYLFDTNNKWVEVSVNGSTPAGIINPDPLVEVVNEGDLFYNTSDHRLYVYNGTSWVATDNLLGNGQIYVGNSSNVATPVTMSGDALITNAGKIIIQPNAVTNEKLDKLNIPLSGFGNPIDNVSLGDGTTNNRIVNLANPIDQQDAVTKGYVMSALSSPSNFLVLPSGNFFVGNASGKAAAAAKSSIPLNGFGVATANVSLGDGTTNFKIVNMANPTGNQDAATKYYVDTRVISPNNLTLPTGNVLVGGAINTATPVAKNTIPISDFGAATADVLLGNGTLNFKIGNLANPTANQDAATKYYVDTKIIDPNNMPLAAGTFFVGNVSNKAASTLKSAISLSGFGAAADDVSLGNFKLTGLATPISDNDAANKKYIDDLFSNPTIGLALPSGNLFMGNGSGKAAAVAKNTIPVSAFGAATTNVNMGNATTQYNISFLADPMYDQDAATKKYVDDKVANPGSISLAKDYLLVGNASGIAEELAAGSFPLSNFGAATDDLVLGNGTTNYKITNLADPTDTQDAATKKYVDDLSASSGTSALADGKIFVGNASGKASPVSLSGDGTIDNMGKMVITDDAISAAKLNADVAGSGLKQNGTGALEVDVTTIPGGSISSSDLQVTGGSNAALTNVVISIPDNAITDAKLDKANIPLSGFSAPTTDLSAGSFKITNLSDPTVDQDAATKKYVDDLSASSGTSALADGKIFVGNVAGVANPVSLSGDASIDNTGKITIADDAVSAAKLNPDVAGAGLKQNSAGALEVDATTLSGGSISSSDLQVTGGNNAALTNVAISIPDNAITDAKLDKANIPLSGFGAAGADIQLGDGTNNFKITNLSDPTVDQDATTKKYVDGLVAGVTSVFSLPKGNMLVGDDSGKAASTAKSAITLSGFKEAEANISMGSGSNNYKIINLADPSGDQDATTKKYVDSKTAELTTGTTPPVSPKVGSTYYNTTEKVFYVYDGTQWVPVDNKLTSGQLYVGDATNKAISTPQSALSLSGFGVPTADLSVGSFNITNLADPTDAQDAATKKYVDDLSASSGSSALADGKIFVGNVVGVANPVSLSGDATIDNTGKMAITDDAVSAAKLNADVAGSGLKQNVSGALEVDVTTISGGSISSSDLLVTGGSNAALTNVVISIPDKAITNAKLDKTNIPLSGFAPAGADIQLGNGTNNFKISNLLDPTADQDATTKKYVDSKTDGLTTGTTPPVSPKVGSTYYNTTEKVFYVYDGTQWVPVDNKLANGQLYVGDASNIARATAPGTLSLSGFGAPNADLSAGSFKITNLSDPTVEQDASTKKYVDDLVAGVTSVFSLPKGNMLVGDDSGKAASTAKSAITLSGFKEAEANISMGSGSNNYKITNLANPTGDQDAATKKYVDNTAAASKDNLGNHTATQALKMGSYSVSNDGDTGDGVAFDTDGHATFGKDVTVNGNFYTPSDKRLKTDIETLTNVLEKIDRLRGVQFEYKDQKKYATGSKIGLIAQELQLVYPEMVTQGEDGLLKVDYTQLTGVLIQAVKEQQMQINTLKTEMARLQGQINEILQKIK